MSDEKFMVFAGDVWGTNKGFNAYRGRNTDIDEIKKNFETNDEDYWCQIVDMNKWEVVSWGYNTTVMHKWEWEDEGNV